MVKAKADKVRSVTKFNRLTPRKTATVFAVFLWQQISYPLSMTEKTFSPLLDKLIQSLRCLPGVGQRSAQRMAFYLLEENQRKRGLTLAETLSEALHAIKHCDLCQTYTEESRCKICASTSRDPHLLCVVESPADVMAIEQTHSYRGRYHVLMGHLSPLDGIGPEQLGVDKLFNRFKEETIEEVILATNPTVEGEATAHYIASQCKHLPVKITRLAHGVPMGGELEYIDGNTLMHALKARETL